MVRGLTDSVLRDHMLEMQGFVLSFALTIMQRQKRKSLMRDPTGVLTDVPYAIASRRPR